MDINKLAEIGKEAIRNELNKDKSRDPLDGDETQAIADQLLKLLDFNEGNITNEELEAEPKQEYFPITSLHRDDFIMRAKETDRLTKKLEKKINALKDWEMAEYAEDLADGFLETDLYWVIISNILDELEKKK